MCLSCDDTSEEKENLTAITRSIDGKCLGKYFWTENYKIRPYNTTGMQVHHVLKFSCDEIIIKILDSVIIALLYG